MHWLTRISIGNRWITIVVALVITAASIFATLQLKTELIPDIELPYVMVVAISEGSSADEIMEDIAIPVEEEIQDHISGLKHIESTSQEGQTFVFATFEYGTDMDKAEEDIAVRLAERGDEISDLLESEDLMVVRISMEMIPLVWLSLYSNNDMTGAELRAQAQMLADETIANVDGILEDETPMMKPVEVLGGEEPVLVIPDAEAMNTYGIPTSWLISSLGSAGEYASLQEIESTPVLATGRTVGQVATVSEPVSESYVNGNPSVTILWRKDPDANTVDVANAIMAEVRDFESSSTEGIQTAVVFDQSDMIEKSVSNLARDAAIGVVLAGIIVLVFLWAFGASLIITVTIPLSVLVGFLLMNVFGITINMLTLGGMAIAVGRIVDNSIVCLENIYRHLQRGEGFRGAAIDGVKEVAMPITSATIATVAIFIPLMLVGGLVGELFRPFGLTVTFALLASLVVALMVVPPLASFMSTGKVKFEGEKNWYTRAYTRALRWSLGHRAIVILIAFVVFVGSLFMVPLLSTSFIPGTGVNIMTVTMQMPYGNDSDAGALLEEVGEAVEELNGQPVNGEDGKVLNYYSYIGNPMGMGGNVQGTILVELAGSADMDSEAAALQDLCDSLAEESANTIKVDPGFADDAMFASDNLEVRVIGVPGVEEEILESVTDVTQTLTEQVQELQDQDDIENLKSELILNQTNASKDWDYAAGLAAYALTLGVDPTNEDDFAELVAQLEGEWALMRFGWPIEQLGQESPTVTVGEISTGISVPGPVVSLSDMEDIEDLYIGATSPTMLGGVATVEALPAQYFRAEGGYAGAITGKITSGNVGATNADVQNLIDDLELPAEVDEVTMGGVAEQMMEGFSQMFVAIGLAIVIVYVVLLVSFRSWLTPLLIMAALPLALIGAVVALLVTSNPLGMSAMMGVLMLVGIVLTNAIVFLTFVEDRRKEGYSTHDALMDAGRIRLRPILMTALTTMIALIPLSLGIGEGTLIAAELGVVVIGGLFSSTLLTLLVVPVLYSLTDRIRRKAPVKADSPVETS